MRYLTHNLLNPFVPTFRHVCLSQTPTNDAGASYQGSSINESFQIFWSIFCTLSFCILNLVFSLLECKENFIKSFTICSESLIFVTIQVQVQVQVQSPNGLGVTLFCCATTTHHHHHTNFSQQPDIQLSSNFHSRLT